MLFESLELRQLMSVSVQALPNGGVLVKGTNGDDVAFITQPDAGQVVVMDATVDGNGQINPTGVVYSADSGVKYLVVDLGAGNDSVAFYGWNSNAVIFTGNGNDLAQVNTFGTQSVALDTGNRDDIVEINAAEYSTVSAFAGNGSDSASIVVSDQAHVYYNAGPGADETSITNNGDPCQIVYNSGSGADSTQVLLGSYIGG